LAFASFEVDKMVAEVVLHMEVVEGVVEEVEVVEEEEVGEEVEHSKQPELEQDNHHPYRLPCHRPYHHLLVPVGPEDPIRMPSRMALERIAAMPALSSGRSFLQMAFLQWGNINCHVIPPYYPPPRRRKFSEALSSYSNPLAFPRPTPAPCKRPLFDVSYI
uniref:Ovule protein n=1 Tax=Haemonchus placei TaxID=6290 RepID=A0A0N4WVA7_HAEPC